MNDNLLSRKTHALICSSHHALAALIPLTRGPKTHEGYAPKQTMFAPGTFSKGSKFKFARYFWNLVFRTTSYMQITTKPKY